MPASERRTEAPTPPREAVRDVIVVTGQGSAELRPSQVILDVGLACRAGSPGDALTAVTARAEAVIAAARGAGLAEEDLQTQGLAVAPHFDSKHDRVVDYRSSYTLELTVRDVAGAPGVVDAVAGAAGDALRLGGFRLTSPLAAAARAEAGVAAVRDARDRAERLAAAAGVGLGRVLEIVEDPPPELPIRRPPMRMAAMAAASMAPPLEEGSERVVTHVRITYALAD